jgi:uncharacterized protein YfaQ (DUF2300 family)
LTDADVKSWLQQKANAADDEDTHGRVKEELVEIIPP